MLGGAFIYIYRASDNDLNLHIESPVCTSRMGFLLLAFSFIEAAKQQCSNLRADNCKYRLLRHNVQIFNSKWNELEGLSQLDKI